MADGIIRQDNTKNNLSDCFKWDHNFTEMYVICNVCALARNGLVFANSSHLDLFTKYKNLNGLQTLAFSYYYNDNIDYKYDVTPSQSNELLLKPTKERALVENIIFIDNVDEGFLIEALKNYQEQFWNDRIYEVADHFGLARETLDYWLEEARNDCEI